MRNREKNVLFGDSQGYEDSYQCRIMHYPVINKSEIRKDTFYCLYWHLSYVYFSIEVKVCKLLVSTRTLKSNEHFPLYANYLTSSTCSECTFIFY